LRWKALRKKPDASRACRPKRSRNFRRRGSSAVARTAAERALVWLRTNVLRKQPAASRGVPPEALAEFPPAGIERVRAAVLTP